MGALEQYDARISRVMAKIEAMQDKKFQICVGGWPPQWRPPLTEEKVAAFETEKGIRLPEDYRRFITTVAGSGSQPFYGLEPLPEKDCKAEHPFPYALEHILYFLYMTEEEMDAYYDEDAPFTADHGLLTLCTEGDGMDSVLVVNSDDPDTYGTVWYFDLANDFGIAPMYDPNTGSPFHFLDWLEYWADRTAGLGERDHFQFMETVKLPSPPDDPNIMGRKMGWIK